MSTKTLHYIHDPLCGWCYGAAPLVRAARSVVSVQAHAGGMMAGASRQPVTDALRAFVLPHDRRIAQLTGQVFGPAYTDGLLCDTEAVLDSEPPIAAMLAAQALAERGLDMLAALQIAHYVEGRQVSRREVLIEVAGSLDLPSDTFADTLDLQSGGPAREHILATRGLMAKLGVSGFPAMALETDGTLARVDVSRFLGREEEWLGWLNSLA